MSTLQQPKIAWYDASPTRRTAQSLFPTVVMTAWIVLHIGLWALSAPLFHYAVGSDVHHVYWRSSVKLLAGMIPYQNAHFFIEYPPFAAAFFLIPTVFHPASFLAYDAIFNCQMLLIDIAAFVVIGSLVRWLYPTQSTRAEIFAYCLYGLSAALMGGLVVERFDLFPAILILAAILAILKDWRATAWVLLLVATAVKVYPGVLLPLFAVYDWKRGRRNGLFWYCAGLTAYLLTWLIVGPASFNRFLQYEMVRGVEAESLFASFLYIVHGVGFHIYHSYHFGSSDVTSVLTNLLRYASTMVTAGLLTLLTVSYIRRPRTSNTRLEGQALVTYSLLAVLAFLLGSKLVSPQFILWIVVLLAVQPHRRILIGLMTTIVAYLTTQIFPYHWRELMIYGQIATNELLIRNILLIALFVIVWRTQRRVERVDLVA